MLTATHCNTLQHTAPHCNTLQHTATNYIYAEEFLYFNINESFVLCNNKMLTATHCKTLQHTATHCNTLQHIAKHCNNLYMQVNFLYFNIEESFVLRDNKTIRILQQSPISLSFLALKVAIKRHPVICLFVMFTYICIVYVNIWGGYH